MARGEERGRKEGGSGQEEWRIGTKKRSASNEEMVIEEGERGGGGGVKRSLDSWEIFFQGRFYLMGKNRFENKERIDFRILEYDESFDLSIRFVPTIETVN